MVNLWHWLRTSRKRDFRGECWWEWLQWLREADTQRPKSWGLVACRMWEKEEKSLRVKKTTEKQEENQVVQCPRNQRRRKFQEGRSGQVLNAAECWSRMKKPADWTPEKPILTLMEAAVLSVKHCTGLDMRNWSVMTPPFVWIGLWPNSLWASARKWTFLQAASFRL